MKILLGKEEEYKKYIELNSQDFYSEAVVNYEKKWSEMMEEEIEKGAKLEDVAERTSHEADVEGITGFQYGCAVGSLAHFWQYGEQLRRWHNLDTQIHHEGEEANEKGTVLNPAILTFEPK